MSNSQVTIICPHCQKQVSLDDALTHQLENKFKRDYDEQLQREKINLWKIAQEKALEKIKAQQNMETKLLKEELEEKRKALETAQASELEVRKTKNKLEEEKRAFELEKQRQLDAERNKIRDEVGKILSEQHQLKDAEKDKVINDLKKSLEDAQRKATQGSQQLQGEVQELALEDMLKSEFPFDEISPVGKGMQGADIIQKIHDPSGKLAGSIAWESKRTKAWSEGWIQKLKDDQLRAHADIGVIISNVLPTEIKNFSPKDGIFVSNYECVLGVAYLLRSKLIEVSKAKRSTIGKDEKMESMWNYLTSTEFNQHMTALLTAFNAMKLDIEKEKRVYTKLWAKREKQIQRVFDSAIGLRGDLEGVMGNALPEMKSLEIDELIDEVADQQLLEEIK